MVQLKRTTLESGNTDMLLKEINEYLNKAKLTHIEALNILNTYIKENGLEQSPERLKILEIIFNIYNEFTVNRIYNKIPNGTSIAKATIYNAIKLFTSAKIIKNTRIGVDSKNNCPNGMIRFFEINTK
jgi:Fe2+ or Zn2+ uptake regulation protein